MEVAAYYKRVHVCTMLNDSLSLDGINSDDGTVYVNLHSEITSVKSSTVSVVMSYDAITIGGIICNRATIKSSD